MNMVWRYILVLGLVFLIGCVTQPVTQEEPLCATPYLEFKQGECCLDANSNNICDTDEDQKEVVTPEPAPELGMSDEERIGKGEFEVGDKITLGCFGGEKSILLLNKTELLDGTGLTKLDCGEYPAEVTEPFTQYIVDYSDTEVEVVGVTLLDSNKEVYFFVLQKDWYVKEMFLYEQKQEKIQKEIRTGYREVFEEVVKGSATKTTRSFYVNSDEWKVHAAYSAYEPDYLGMMVYIYRKGDNQLVTMLSIDGYFLLGGGYMQMGDTYVYEGPGEYYLEVTSANVETWRVVVSEKI